MKKEMMVTMEQRAEHITELLTEQGFNYKVTHRKVWKNNTELDGFAAVPEDGGNITPTVYVNDETDEQLAIIIQQAMQRKMPEVSLEKLFEHEYFKENLRPRLIPDNKINRNGLKESGIEYIPFDTLGLLITLEITVDGIEDRASIQLTRKHLDMAGYTFSEAYDQAVRNMEEDIEVWSMREIMAEMMNIPDEQLDMFLPEDSAQMFVLSNHHKMYGAAALLSKKAYQLLAERLGTDEYFILPSSVHEVIVIRKEDTINASDLLDMVMEVNQTQVQSTDRLADAVFLYNGNLTKVA